MMPTALALSPHKAETLLRAISKAKRAGAPASDEIADAMAAYRRAMTLRKSMVERLHERRFLVALVVARGHLCVHVPDVPAIGDRKMTRVRASINEHEAIFTEHAVAALIIDEA